MNYILRLHYFKTNIVRLFNFPIIDLNRFIKYPTSATLTSLQQRQQFFQRPYSCTTLHHYITVLCDRLIISTTTADSLIVIVPHNFASIHIRRLTSYPVRRRYPYHGIIRVTTTVFSTATFVNQFVSSNNISSRLVHKQDNAGRILNSHVHVLFCITHGLSFTRHTSFLQRRPFCQRLCSCSTFHDLMIT